MCPPFAPIGPPPTPTRSQAFTTLLSVAMGYAYMHTGSWVGP